MAFKVFRNGQEPAEEFGDKDRLEIIEGGVLKIRRQDGTNRYINPACWVSINETPPSTSSVAWRVVKLASAAPRRCSSSSTAGNATCGCSTARL